jgi:glycosyltransferase involved in cell wall biosynthesis
LQDPLVAIVTPVHQGADMLDGCIASVLAQSYSRWVWVVADNASRDATARIALAAASRDARIRVERHARHLGMLEHWNRALSLVPDEAVYVKQLNVDDRMRPGCLERLVETAEAHPEAGVVSSYFQYGAERYPRFEHDRVQVFGGREVVGQVLFGIVGYLAHPSVLLLRRAAAAKWPDFFDPTGFPPGHPLEPPLGAADKQAYFELLERFDLAFVPEVLSDIAKHEGSATAFSARVCAWHPGRIEVLLRHGHRFLEPAERRRALRLAARKYVGSLAWRIGRRAAFRDAGFREYQRLALACLLPRLREESLGWEGVGLRLAGRLLGDPEP